MKFLPLVLRNLLRNKLRTALTGAAIGLAVLLVCFFLTMPAGIDVFLSQIASNVRVSVHHKGGLVYMMPFAYVNKIRSVPGVVGADGVLWFGGAFEEEGHVTFPSFAIEPEHVATVWPDYHIDPAALERFLDLLRQGPRMARIEDVRVRWMSFKGDLGPFGVRG